MSEQNNSPTGSGLQPNVAGLLCYLGGWITGIIFLVIEKENKFVRFHAVQSIIVFGVYTVLAIILGFIPIVGWILGIVFGIIFFILWIVLMMKAYNGQLYKLPIVGNIAENQVK